MASKGKKVDNQTEMGKRHLKISKVQQQNLVIVLITSLLIGVSVVLVGYFVKYIQFDDKVIDAKEAALRDYTKTVANIGVCKKPAGSVYTDEELKSCNPNALDSTNLPGSLRYNVMVGMAQNTDLESVARDSDGVCYDSDGLKINFRALYDMEDNEEKRNYYFGMMKMCSSLRVIPDALPPLANPYALASSVNYIFNLSNWQFGSLTPGEPTEGGSDGLGTMSANFSIEGDIQNTMNLLSNLERSIRTFEMTNASIEWGGENDLKFSTTANAYFLTAPGIKEGTKTIKANK
ncbi:MAG: hypothetical protein Q4F60_02920 [Candidatus Saccharibacteria bacterium]|nr:hypothetical protein [Candidatus Saccharibacteria bacterium]